MNDGSPIFEAHNLFIRRDGHVVLDIPELQIFKGEILSIIGPNGAGKTTLLQTIMHLLKTKEGEIYLKGKKIDLSNSAYKYRRNFGLVFQEPLLFNTTVFKNVASGLEIRGMGKKRIEEMVDLQLNRFGIAHLKKRSARAISGGEAQRASLARAFATRPEILLLDEPFAALDIPTRESIIEDLERVLRETRTTTILATHDRMEALRLSNRIAIISAGRILQIGTPHEIMNRPVNEFVAAFAGTEIILSGNVSGIQRTTFSISVEGKDIVLTGRARKGERLTIGLRPENVVISVGHAGKTSARNSYKGVITKIVPTGFFYKIYIDCGFNLISHVTTQSKEDLALAAGRKVTASFKATSVHIIKRQG